MQETLGIVFIAMAVVLMGLVGIYGLVPIVMRGRLAPASRAALATPRSQEELLKAVSQPALDPGTVEELLAQLYSVRIAVAELSTAFHRSEESQTEAASPPPAEPGVEAGWYGVDQGALDELFAELFSIRTAVASLSAEVRGLRETVQAAEPPRRRSSRKAAA